MKLILVYGLKQKMEGVEGYSVGGRKSETPNKHKQQQHIEKKKVFSSLHSSEIFFIPSHTKFNDGEESESLATMRLRELKNLYKGADSRKRAMKALKSYVKDLDNRTIPIFFAQVSKTKETGTLLGEFTISLYEVVARVRGVKIVPMIDSIVQSVVQTLSSCAGSFPLQQACSKVVLAVARNGIDPSTPEEQKRHIIHSICKPLSDSITCSHESLSCGAALCFKALLTPPFFLTPKHPIH